MPNTFPVVLQPPVSVTFASSYPLAEAVERLRAATVPPGFDADSSESAMGTVTSDHVRLERNQPWPRNRFLRPYFVGTFEQGKHGVVLTGRFAEDRHTRFFTGTLAGAVFFGPRAFRNDVVWLSAFIEQTLSKVPNHTLQPTTFGGD